MKYTFFFLQIFFAFSRLQARPDSIKFEKTFLYTHEVGINIVGGLKTGMAWTGQFRAMVDVPLYLNGIQKRSNFHLDFMATRGSAFSSLTGDIQIASNMEAPSLTTLFEFWYEQQLNNHRLKFGLIDLNSEFLFTERALQLLNSSFGIQPTLSGNMPLSIYPVNALGMIWEYRLSPGIGISTGLFDGRPSMDSGIGIIPDLTLNFRDGFFIIQEMNVHDKAEPEQFTLKLGAWIHTGSFLSSEGILNGNFGGYLIADKALMKMEKGTVFGWVKTGFAPRNCNVIRNFNGAGLTYQNPFGSGKRDFISIAVANAILCKEYHSDPLLKRHETVLELTIHKRWHYFIIQPDIQYILNPSGSGSLKNPVCLIFRLQVVI